MNWKSIGSAVLSLGITEAMKWWARRRAPRALEEMLDAALKTGVVPPALAKAMDLAKRAQFNARVAELLAANEHLLAAGKKHGLVP